MMRTGELLEITEPVTHSEIHALMEPLSGGDCYDFDIAVYEAESGDLTTAEHRSASSSICSAYEPRPGLASESDAA